MRIPLASSANVSLYQLTETRRARTLTHQRKSPDTSRHFRHACRDEPDYRDSIVWSRVLQWVALTPPDMQAAFSLHCSTFLFLCVSAELQLASATKSESYWHRHTRVHSAASDGKGCHGNIPPLFLSLSLHSALHQQQVHRGRGEGVRNNKRSHFPSNIIVTAKPKGYLDSSVCVCVWGGASACVFQRDTDTMLCLFSLGLGNNYSHH